MLFCHSITQLARAIGWAVAERHTLVGNTTMVGGEMRPTKAGGYLNEDLISGDAHAFHRAISDHKAANASKFRHSGDLWKAVCEISVELSDLCCAFGVLAFNVCYCALQSGRMKSNMGCTSLPT